MQCQTADSFLIFTRKRADMVIKRFAHYQNGQCGLGLDELQRYSVEILKPEQQCSKSVLEKMLKGTLYIDSTSFACQMIHSSALPQILLTRQTTE
jgi:hypothetical protein